MSSSVIQCDEDLVGVCKVKVGPGKNSKDIH